MSMLSRRLVFSVTFLVLAVSWAAPVAAGAGRDAAEDFFRVEQRGDKWYMIDPERNPFHMRGCNHYSNGTHMPWNLSERYDNDRVKWMAELRDRHREWGFTFLAPSIVGAAIDPAKLGASPAKAQLVVRVPEWTAEDRVRADFPFTPFLGVPKEYMAGEGMGDVWSEEFLAAVDARCRELVAPLRDNKQLIGYHFSHNPPWNSRAISFEMWIRQCTRPGSPGLKQWGKLMQRIYGTIDRWREVYGVPIDDWSDIEKLQNPLNGYVSAGKQLQDMDAFMRLICEQWYRVHHDAIRRYDPNHLILGDRNTLHLQPPLQPWAIDIMRRYVDVLSVNVMGPPDTVYESFELVTRHWDGPILLADTGAGVYQGEPAKAGYQARDLAEFEACYRGLMEMSLDHPQIIGIAWCGWYGHPLAKSPNIDRLAQSGTVFLNAYCQQAVCAPSRASLLSGCRPDTTGIYDLQTPLRQAMPDVLTLPQLFKKAGYTTVSLGKIYHHANDDPEGWTECDAVADRGVRYALKDNQEIIRRKHQIAKNKGERIRYWHGCANATECADVADGAYRDGAICQATIDALRQHQQGPFFLAVGFHRPHLPFVAPKRYWDLYDRERFPLPSHAKPVGAPAIAFDNWGELRAYSDISNEERLDEAKTRELIHGYYACVSYVDALVGRLLAELDRLGLRDRTVVVLWGDHGWKLGDYGQWCKHTNFEFDTHAPLIFRAPGFAGNLRSPALVEFVDVYPTLADLCGLGAPQHCEGVSFVPLLHDPNRRWKTAAFSQYPRAGNVMGYSMRTDRYRYTEWLDQDTGEITATEFYDHDTGPLASRNLASDPDYADTVKQLSAKLKAGWKAAISHERGPTTAP